MALGAMAGLGGALAVFVVLGVSGLVDRDNTAVPVAFLQFLGQLAAGFVAARLAGRDGVLHGSYAALTLYFVASAITLAAAPDAVGAVTILVFAVVAAILGSAGGLLAEARHRPPG